MAAPSPEDIGQAFHKIDALRLTDIEHDKRISFAERDISDIRRIQSAQDVKVTSMEAAILGKLDLLFEDKNIQKGRGQVITWVPTVVTCIIGITTLIAIIRG